MVLDEGFAWNGKTYGSLSQIAKAMTGTSWNGHRFFGLRQGAPKGQKPAHRAPALSLTPPNPNLTVKLVTEHFAIPPPLAEGLRKAGLPEE